MKKFFKIIEKIVYAIAAVAIVAVIVLIVLGASAKNYSVLPKDSLVS